MKKYITLICSAAFIFLLNGCDEESFDFNLYQANVNDIDSVALSTGAYYLIANGQAELEFIVDAYRTVRYEGDDFDTKVKVDIKTLPEGAVKVLDENGTLVGMTYTTDNASAGTKTFTAQIGSTNSIPHVVVLREQPAAFDKIYVDVIFHVCELSPSDSGYDPLSYKELEPSKLQAALDDLNAVINNQLGNGPNGASANIEFRLATERKYLYYGSPMSEELETSGYHKVTYDQSWIPEPAYSWQTKRTYYYPQDFTDKFDASPDTYIWDTSEYLNVYLLPFGANTGLPPSMPRYQIVPDGGTEVSGMGTSITSEEVSTIEMKTEHFGVFIARSPFFRGDETSRTEIAGAIGGYYGVIADYANDHCIDTRAYEYAGSYDNNIKLIKMDVNGNKFKANNALDALTAPSLRNTFTLDQVNRIRYCIENCPVRAHGKDQ